MSCIHMTFYKSSHEKLSILTFIRTHRKSHTKELWGLLGPQDLVLYPCNNKKTTRAISIAQINEELIGNKMTANHLPIIMDMSRKSGTLYTLNMPGIWSDPKDSNLWFFIFTLFWFFFSLDSPCTVRTSNLNLFNWQKGAENWK